MLFFIILFAVVAALFVFYTVKFARYRKNRKQYRKTYGMVRSKAESNIGVYMRYEFETENQERYEGGCRASRFGFNDDDISMEVYYDAEDPEKGFTNYDYSSARNGMILMTVLLALVTAVCVIDLAGLWRL